MPFYRFLIFNLPSARSSANAESLLFGIIRLRINEAMRIAEKCKHFCLSIIAFSIYLLRFLFRCMTQTQINSIRRKQHEISVQHSDAFFRFEFNRISVESLKMENFENPKKIFPFRLHR